eukprot:4189637-Prorocentrum_lima.AAC.1
MLCEDNPAVKPVLAADMLELGKASCACFLPSSNPALNISEGAFTNLTCLFLPSRGKEDTSSGDALGALGAGSRRKPAKLGTNKAV